MKIIAVLPLTAALLALGCGGPAPTRNETRTKAAKDDHHHHDEGPHGGVVADWGGGKYHTEFIADHDKQEATIYILDGSAKKAAPIKARDGKITASLTGVKDKAAFEVILEARPQEGDPPGASSRFVGKHEKIGVKQEFEGTITGEHDGTPYTGDFKEEPAKK